MNWLILLALIAIVPIVLAIVFRISAVYIFLSAAAGSLLVSYVGDDAALALSMFFRGQNTTVISQFILQLLPVALTILFLKKTMPHSKILLHIFPLITSGLMLAVLVLPFIDTASQQQIFANHYGEMLKELQDLIVGVATLSVLVLAWVSLRHKEGKKSKKAKLH